MSTDPDLPDDAIAITGLAGRFPGAADAFAFWRNLEGGRESLSRCEEDSWSEAAPEGATRVPVKGVLDAADAFDAAFFDIRPRNAALMDPQHRVFLECAYHALEDAGLLHAAAGARIGVFAGASAVSSYYHAHLLGNPATVNDDPFQMMLANQSSAIANLVSYRFGLTGPSVALNTACSTGLVAVAMAATHLLDGQCDAAIAGASSVSLPLRAGYWHLSGGILSPEGRCRPFTPAADGTVPGNGVGAVVLRRLDDAVRDGDHIYAVLRGFAVNNDGAQKVGYTAPGVAGQTEVVAEALAASGLDAADIAYVETHGTGTALGDAIELAALGRALGGAERPVTLGTVKNNIGHLDAAAGIAGLIKVALMLDRGRVPPSAHVAAVGAALEGGRFRLAGRPEPFGADGRRAAAVSSFGMGGTNAHAILEPAPNAPPRRVAPDRPVLLALGGRSPETLAAFAHGLAEHLSETKADLRDAAYTLLHARPAMVTRAAIVARDRADAVRQLAAFAPSDARPSPPSTSDGVVFVVPGQGVRLAGMARRLAAAEPVFGDALSECLAILRGLGVDLAPALLCEEADAGAHAARLERTEFAQPAGFALAWSLAKLLGAWGVRPSAMIGHSVGEYVTAALAGVMRLPDALHLVVQRGALIQRLPGGAMVAVRMAAKEAEGWIAGESGLAIAALNGPNATVIAGETRAIDALTQRLSAAGATFTRLPVSHAFHSPMMDAALAPLERAVEGVALSRPLIPTITTRTGGWITDAATDPGHYARQMREPVRFADGISTLLAEGHTRFVELGQGALASQVRQGAAARGVAVTAVGALGDGDPAAPLAALGALWCAGLPLDAAKLTPDARHISLPPTPLLRTRHWIDAPGAPARQDAEAPAPPPMPATNGAADATLAAICQLWSEHFSCAVEPESNYYALGGDSLLAVRIVAALNHRLGSALSPSVLAEAPTPAALARRVKDGATARPFELVALKAGAPGLAPLFLPHAVGGTVDLYAPLAAALPDDQPVYALQSSALDGRHTPRMDVAENAARLLAAMRAVQAEGPYHLAGSSFGGMLAYEIARQLAREGEEVALLALIDTPAMDALPRALMTDADTVSHVAGLLGRDIPVDELRPLPRAAQIERLIAVCGDRLPRGIAPEELDLHLRIFSANSDAMRAYEITPIAVPEIIFFRAATRLPHMPAHPERPWVERLGDRVRVIEVAGDHLSMMNAPEVSPIAARLSQALRPARRSEAPRYREPSRP
ncbi:type I polyketide synthase [Acuticoccus kandeliae]|uniref:type I polyketide synthase n=1 Tax=Acuticoccus kandeliae TaxID=2073160 RepID=UPI000D3EAEE0|nr:type I polyketide synthase [Acuticoccus kandeliae]